jgi:uncharacterized membrane protein YkvA (DUF1232 family)
MSQKNPAPFDPGSGMAPLMELLKRFRLVWLLFRDHRVPYWVKAVLPASLLYLISPVDLIPGALFPIVGGLDDVGIILLGMALFMKLAPGNVVEEYRHQLEYGDLYNDEAINTTYRVIDED